MRAFAARWPVALPSCSSALLAATASLLDRAFPPTSRASPRPAPKSSTATTAPSPSCPRPAASGASARRPTTSPRNSSTCCSPSRTGASATTPASIRWRWRAPPPVRRDRACRLRRLDPDDAGRAPAGAAAAHPALQADRDACAPCSSKPLPDQTGHPRHLAHAGAVRRQPRRRARRLARLVRRAARRSSTRRRRRCSSPSRAAPRRCAPTATPTAARALRDRVLALGVPGLFDRLRRCRPHRLPLPRHAPQIVAALPPAPRSRPRSTCRLQAALERLADAQLATLPRACLAGDAHRRYAHARNSGDLSAAPGGQESRAGALDLTRAIRSPGSALKPFIYALAFQDGITSPDAVLSDLPRHFGGYAPENFDRGFAGRVTAGEALRRSLNLPAVALLDRIGPTALRRRVARGGHADPPAAGCRAVPAARTRRRRDHLARGGGTLCRPRHRRRDRAAPAVRERAIPATPDSSSPPSRAWWATC